VWVLPVPSPGFRTPPRSDRGCNPGGTAEAIPGLQNSLRMTTNMSLELPAKYDWDLLDQFIQPLPAMPFRFHLNVACGLRIWLAANLPAPLRDTSNNLARPSLPHRNICLS
jgi:hypothetical protein